MRAALDCLGQGHTLAGTTLSKIVLYGYACAYTHAIDVRHDIDGTGESGESGVRI